TGRLPADARGDRRARGGLRAVRRSPLVLARGSGRARAARPRRVGRRPRDHGEGLGAPAPVTAPRRPALRAGGAAGAALRRRAVAGGLRARLSRVLPMILALAVGLPHWLGGPVVAGAAVRGVGCARL